MLEVSLDKDFGLWNKTSAPDFLASSLKVFESDEKIILLIHFDPNALSTAILIRVFPPKLSKPFFGTPFEPDLDGITLNIFSSDLWIAFPLYH